MVVLPFREILLQYGLPPSAKIVPPHLGVPFLGAIPLDPAVRKAADEGRPFLIRSPGMPQENPTWKQVDAVMENLVRVIEDESVSDVHREEESLPAA